MICLILKVASATSSDPKDVPSCAMLDLFPERAILAHTFVIPCHIEIKFGHPLCKIIFNFLKWEPVLGMLPLESEPEVTLGCDASRDAVELV